MRMFSNILDKNTKEQTSYGVVSNDEWCDLEVERLNKSYGKTCFFKKEIKDQVVIMTKTKPLSQVELIANGWRII